MHLLKDIKDALLHLAFPHVCEGCGGDTVRTGQYLCLHCLDELPATNFHFHPANPVEKLFWGRLPLVAGTAHYYFTRESLMQRLMHQLKYRGNKEIGFYLGRLMGQALFDSNRFLSVDGFVPLPLHKSKEHKRGYNQAAVLCQGIASVFERPVLNDVIARNFSTETQTKKGRVDRWLNIEGRFSLINKKKIDGRHLLLVDDVVTTGATIESCGRELLSGRNTRLSIATLCFSSH